MKSFTISLNRFLLLTSMLFAPTLAMAQEAQPQPDLEPEVESAQQAPDPADEFGTDDEIVVLGRNIPEPMRQTSQVATFLSNEDLERQGDDTAAEALTRLTGLSVLSGRFVFVRGLGDRYSSATLNGMPLPSPEPLRRTVPLDLFPSNILDGATVQKTFSPNYPGEFGGGIIDLRTVAQPSEPFFQMKFGMGTAVETTGRDGLFYHGGDRDWTTFDDGTRDIPGPLAAAIAVGDRISDGNFDVDTLEEIGESFVNSPLTVIQRRSMAPDVEVEMSGGTTYEFGRFEVGLIGVAGYDSSWRTQQARRGVVARDTIGEDFESFTTAWDVTLNGLGGISLGWDEHLIQMTGLYVHSSTREAQQVEGFDFNAIGNQTYKESTAWYERELATLQLGGDHVFGDLEIGWRGSLARSTRDAPYERQVSWLVDSIGPIYAVGNANSTRFSTLTDDVVGAGIDASYTIALSDQRDAVFSAGYDYTSTEREYELLQFVFGGSLNLATEEDVARARVDYLFSPDNIDPQRFEIFELTGPDDSYFGSLEVHAAYFNADIEIMPLLRAAVGVRYEDASQSVVTSNRFGDPTTPPVSLENTYWLPAVTLTWNFAENLQLRLGYSNTIARPQFRELAISPYIDPDSDRTYRGNPGLVDSELANFDARLEYYFGRNQFFTAGVFYKDIQNPIEEVITETSLFNFVTRFINAPRAVLYGGEFEYRTRFDMPFDGAWFDDKDWLFAINYTYTFSEVQAEAGDFIINPLTGVPTPAENFDLDGSELQGTPPHILNVQFGYETDVSQLTLLVGWVDERILRRGFGQGLPDVIENPGINIDLVYRRNFTVNGQDFTFGLSGRNLLGEQHQEYQESDIGRVDFNTYDRGQTFSASLTAKF